MAKRGYSLARKQAQLGIIFLLPALLLIAFIILYPLGNTLVLGFFKRNLMNPTQGTQLIGIDNFLYFMKKDVFWKAFLNGVLLTGIGVGIQVIVGMIIALLLNMSFRGRGLARGIFILPWATPTFVAAFAWIWLLDAQYGIVNMILKKLHIISEGVPWFGQLSTALACVIVAHVWKGLPWVVMVLLSGLQMVPKELQEAARVDGATAWREFWNVIVPSMKNVLLIVVLLRVIWTFNWFDYVFLLTGGGPLDATMTWPVLIYKTAFEAYRFGRASALGGVVFVVVVIFTFIYFRVLSKEGNL